MRNLTFVCALGALSFGCDDTRTEDDFDDHVEGTMTFEGEEVGDWLGADATSDPITVESGFRRVGLLWDAAEQGALEIRTRLDGEDWSAWRAPTLVSSEEGAHAGHVDAFDLAGEASGAGDPVAVELQVRVAAGRAAPTFLVVEPLPDIPARFEGKDVADVTDDVSSEYDTRTTPIGNIRIYTRADWGARAPRCASGSMTPNRVTIHHTVTPTNDSMSPQARLRQIQAYHQNSNGWCDIGYNYLISRDGRVWRARGATTVGAHVSNNNTGNIGVSFMGTHTSTAPTSTQMCQAAKLLRRLSMDFSAVDLTRSDVKGHRQYGGTVCPGNALYDRIDKIIRKAKNGCSAE
jgi:hypothetical protein